MSKKLKPAELFEMALAECLLKWAIFETRELKYFEWAWEFLRRNQHYINAYNYYFKRLHEHEQKYEDFLEARLHNRIVAHMPLSLFDSEERFLEDIEKLILITFGLCSFVGPDEEIMVEHTWMEQLAPKVHAELRLLMAYNSREREISNLRLEKGDHIMLISEDAPIQAYRDELDRIEAKIKKKKKIEIGKGRDIHLYPQYLRAYDLYMWGKENGRGIKKGGKIESCIRLKYIADYLYSRQSPDDKTPKLKPSGVLSYIEIAEDMIHGGYKRLLKRKGTS